MVGGGKQGLVCGDEDCRACGVVIVPGGIMGGIPGGRVGKGTSFASLRRSFGVFATSVGVRVVGSFDNACVSSCVGACASCFGCGKGAHVGEDAKDDPGACWYCSECCGWLL